MCQLLLGHTGKRNISKKCAKLLLSLLLVLGAHGLGQVEPGAKTEAEPREESDAPKTPASGLNGISEEISTEGISVRFDVTPIKPNRPASEGRYAEVRFTITDTLGKNPIPGLSPAAWIDPRLGDRPRDRDSCKSMMEGFISGSMGLRAELDMNSFYVLTMNDEPNIAVVDPLFSFGGSKLLAMAFLQAPGWDWALSDDQMTLYVSMPEVSRVAVVDTVSWKVPDNWDTGPNPKALALQPDGRYLWIACEGNGRGDGGMAVFDTVTGKKATFFEIGDGPKAFRFDGSGGQVFVADRDSGSVLVYDAHRLGRLSRVTTGKAPVALDYSLLADAVFVADAENGTVTVIDARDHEIRTVSELKPGLHALRFSPMGEVGVVLNPGEHEVSVLDPATGRVIKSGRLGKRPDQISFTDTLGYVRSLDDELVWMLPLEGLGREGELLSAVDFTGGQNPPGTAGVFSGAPAIVQAPEGLAVLVANPADEAIFYYREGMAAPMGSFRNYGGRPRAVMVLDKSLREEEPGVYVSRVRLPEAGNYDAAFFLDSPRIIHCFDVPVVPDARVAKKRKNPELQPQFLLDERQATAGEPYEVRFRLKNKETGSPVENLEDVGVLIFHPGNWQQLYSATASENGDYRVSVQVPKPGTYYLFLSVPSMGLNFNGMRPLVLKAAAAEIPNSAQSQL